MSDDYQSQRDALEILKAVSAVPTIEQKLEVLQAELQRLSDSQRDQIYNQKDFGRSLDSIKSAFDELKQQIPKQIQDEIKAAAPDMTKSNKVSDLYEKAQRALALCAVVYILSKALGLTFPQVLKAILAVGL